MKTTTEHQNEAKDEPHVGDAADMAATSRRLIAHSALHQVCAQLAQAGVGPNAIVSALMGIAAGELVAQCGRQVAAEVVRDFAAEIEAGPVTLRDVEAAGHG